MIHTCAVITFINDTDIPLCMMSLDLFMLLLMIILTNVVGVWVESLSPSQYMGYTTILYVDHPITIYMDCHHHHTCMDPHYHMWATALYIDMSVLTGAGESGKSTIVKQMKILHKDGYSDQ